MNAAKFNKDQVFDYITTADSWLNINDAFGSVRIRELMQPLIDSINDDGGVSYVLGEPKRYRTSTLATVLDALFDVKLLPLAAVHQMQKHLYDLKDSFSPLDAADDKINKLPEDVPAWGIDETPSVWTTSMAIITLVNTGFASNDATDRDIVRSLRDSVYWLTEQAYSDGGWGYQKYNDSDSCKSSVPMTALAMKAIILAQNDGQIFNFDAKSNHRFNKITATIQKGKEYLIQQKKEREDKYVYWEYDNKEGVSVTTWVLETLSLLAKSSLPCYRPEDFEPLKIKIINYIYSQLPDDNGLQSYCQSEKFFVAKKSDGLKYKPSLRDDKAFYTFKPFIISKLLDLGESPYNPKIVLIVKWLLENREQHWIIEEYNSSSPCSISAAMAINVIVKWLKCLSEKTFSGTVNSLISDGPSTDDRSYTNNSLKIPIPVIFGAWVASSIFMYLPINSFLELSFVKDLAANMFAGEKYVQVLILGAAGSILGAIIIWLFTKIGRIILKRFHINFPGGSSDGSR